MLVLWSANLQNTNKPLRRAFLNPVDGSNDDGSNGNGSTPDNNKNNTTPTAAGEPGSATSNHELHFFTAMILAVALAVSQGFA